MGAPIIKSGLSTHTPMVFAKTRQGFMVGVNGIDRGIFWDGRSSLASELGIDPPFVSPSVYTPTQGDIPAAATLTIATNDASKLDGKYVSIKDSEGKQVSYYFDSSVTFNNKALKKGSEDFTFKATVAIGGLSGSSSYANALMHAIHSAFGHRGTLDVTRSGSTLTITMANGGAPSNGLEITDNASSNITSTAFTGGKTLGGSAYLEIECYSTSTGDYDEDTITLISSDKTSKTYVLKNGAGDAATGLLDGTNVIINIYNLSTLPLIAAQIKRAITGSSGHDGKILVGLGTDNGKMTLYQKTPGTSGNTTATRTGSGGLKISGSSSAGTYDFTNGTSAGGAIAGSYLCYYRYLDERDSERYYSNLSVAARVQCSTDDKFEWSYLAPPPQTRVDKIQLLRSTFNSASVFYVVAELPAGGAITSATDSSGSLVLTLPEGHGVIAGMGITVIGTSGSTGDCHNNCWRVASVTSTTATMTKSCDGGSSEGGKWKVEGYYQDNLQDHSMITYRGECRVKALQNNGLPNANRHSPPPNFKTVCCSFQDRMTYLVDAEYTEGKVGGDAGSTKVTGVDTKWPSSLVGRTICPDPETDCGAYRITAVVAENELTISKPLEHSFKNEEYSIVSPAAERNSIYISEQDLPESVITQIVIQENVRDEDDLVGAVVMNAAYFALKQHSIYRITWAIQPEIDSQPSLAAMRGAINHFCADQHEGKLYLMDDEGPYIFQGGQVQPIGQQIADQWSDQVLDFSKKKSWKVKVDPLEEVVYFYVTAVGDSGDKPKRALVFDIRTQTWTQWKWVWEIGDLVKIEHNSQRRLLCGTTTEKWYVGNEGTLDGTSGDGTIRGTVSSASENSIADSTASTSFPIDCEGASIAIVSGAGKGQIAKITKRVDGNNLQTESWLTTPDSTSVYLIGAVEWMWKSGMFKLIEADQQADRYFMVTFNPTENDATLYFRKFDNHSSAPTVMNEWNGGDGVSVEPNDTRAVANLKLSQKEDGDEPGSKYLPWSGSVPAVRGRPTRWVTCEMSGYQGQDRIVIYELEVGGVQ